MKILVIDGQGGRIGKTIIERLAAAKVEGELIAVGTNSIATAAMMKAGASEGATGENPVVVLSCEADVIVGPVGIVAANSLLGEITPRMALAVSESRAQKILVPINKCKITVVGTKEFTINEYIEQAVEMIKQMTK